MTDRAAELARSPQSTTAADVQFLASMCVDIALKFNYAQLAFADFLKTTSRHTSKPDGNPIVAPDGVDIPRS